MKRLPSSAKRGMTVEKHADEGLRASIKSITDQLEEQGPAEYGITELSRRFSVTRRRVYDVINVLEGIGVCHRNGLDLIHWNGCRNIAPTIARIGTKPAIHNPHMSLTDIFPCPCSVGVTSMVDSLITMFFAIGSNTVDIKLVSMFISRDRANFRTTLCKMYQIASILEAVNVISKTLHPREVTLNRKFFDGLDSSNRIKITSVNSLLNKVPLSVMTSRSNELKLSPVSGVCYVDQ